MIINDFEALLQQVKQAQKKQLDIVAENMDKVEDKEQRAFLESALKRAKSGELDPGEFITEFNKVIHGG